LFRAVSDAELNDISRSNGLRTLGNSSYETGKLFATSAQDASNFGRINFALDQKPFTIIEAKASGSVMRNSSSFQADGMKAVTIPTNQLQKVNWVTPHNSTPIPNLDIFQ
jgi:hypothetical protein